jgi:hypothetical protein
MLPLPVNDIDTFTDVPVSAPKSKLLINALPV